MTDQSNLAQEGFPADLLLPRGSANGGRKALHLTQELRAAILAGRLPAGARLPPSRVLAAELAVSRSVVVRAYTDLIADGYLEARQGAGTRVSARAARGALPAARADASRSLLQTSAPVRLLGGLPDAQLFPRSAWLRHYRAVLSALPDAELGYPDHRGAEPLRAALAAHLGRVRGVVAHPDDVLVCAGVTQGLTLLCRALRRAGARRVAVEEPCFGLHREAVALAGIEPAPIPVDPDRGLDVERLAEHDVDAVLLAPAHSFPTGATLDPDRRRTLLSWAQTTGALIIEDDYDAELRYDRTPIAALQGLAPDRVAYLGSPSKALTPALRLGWVAAPSHLVEALEREKRLDDMGTSLLDQLTFARFVHRGDLARHLQRVRPIYRRRRDAVIDALGDLLPGATWSGAAAGLHLHLALPAGTDTGALSAAAYRRGVLLEPAAIHWADAARAPAPALVLGYGTVAEPAAATVIATLAAALAEARPGQPPHRA